MLDSDLAKLYECANGIKTINLAVKRHINRFPERFMFQLTKEECNNIPRFQLETLEVGKGHNIKYLPYAFTEQGVAMLATVLRTKVAEEVSIRIMDAFVKMKKYISTILLEHNKLSEKRKANEVYFSGQIYDAYSKIIDIFNETKEELIIIDAYADKKILDIVKRINTKVIIITKKNNLLTNQDIKTYNEQYNNLKVIYDNTFHDRYFIIDNKTIYHCGTSINRIGHKTYSINLLEDEEVSNQIITNITELQKNNK